MDGSKAVNEEVEKLIETLIKKKKTTVHLTVHLVWIAMSGTEKSEGGGGMSN